MPLFIDLQYLYIFSLPLLVLHLSSVSVLLFLSCSYPFFLSAASQKYSNTYCVCLLSMPYKQVSKPAMHDTIVCHIIYHIIPCNIAYNTL